MKETQQKQISKVEMFEDIWGYFDTTSEYSKGVDELFYE